MGRLIYDHVARLVVDDRTLAHLQVVMGDKMRRREGFAFTWTNGLEEGGGRTTVWVSPQSALSFTFDTDHRHHLSRPWLTALAAASNTLTGLWLIPEPEGDLAAANAETT